MPYVDKVVGHTQVTRTHIDEDGVKSNYPDVEPILEKVWNTPWQPEHMPVGSLIAVDIPVIPECREITCRVTGHARQEGTDWVVITDHVPAGREAGEGGTFHYCHVTHVLERGTGSVVWETDTAYILEQLRKDPVTHHGKTPRTYTARNVHSLVLQLVHVHPQLQHVLRSNHLYDYHPTGIPSLFEALISTPGLVKYRLDRDELADWLTADDRRYLSTVVVNKRRFIKELRRLLPQYRTNRVEAGIAYNKEMEERYAEMVDLDERVI